MKFSERWVREWVDPRIDTEELAARLTAAGFEVESIAPVAGSMRRMGSFISDIFARQKS